MSVAHAKGGAPSVRKTEQDKAPTRRPPRTVPRSPSLGTWIRIIRMSQKWILRSNVECTLRSPPIFVPSGISNSCRTPELEKRPCGFVENERAYRILAATREADAGSFRRAYTTGGLIASCFLSSKLSPTPREREKHVRTGTREKYRVPIDRNAHAPISCEREEHVRTGARKRSIGSQSPGFLSSTISVHAHYGRLGIYPSLSRTMLPTVSSFQWDLHVYML